MCKMGWGAKSIVGVLSFVDRGVLTHRELCMVGWWGSWFLEGSFWSVLALSMGLFIMKLKG